MTRNRQRRAIDRTLAIENFELYSYFRERLINLALSQFEWHGLPETVDRYYMERTLLTKGRCVWFMPESTNFWLALDYQHDSGKWSPYGYPIDVTPIDWNQNHHRPEPGFTHLLFDNNNEMRSSLMLGVNLHARRLYEVEQTFRSNLKHQNTPYVIAASDQGESNSIKTMFQRIFNFDPVIQVKKKGMTQNLADSITAVKTDVPYYGQQLLETRQMVWRDALNMLGISAQSTKKERLLDDEITLNRQEDMISLQSRLLNRVEFANKMNEKYNMNLSVNLSDVSIRAQQMIDDDDRALRDYHDTDSSENNDNHTTDNDSEA